MHSQHEQNNLSFLHLHTVGHNYIGLMSVHQPSGVDMNEKPVPSVISPYVKALAGFVIPKSQITLTEILGKGKPTNK